MQPPIIILEEIVKKPRCFDRCKDQYCDVSEEHCSNRDFPPIHNCPRCDYWFVNIERKLDKERDRARKPIDASETLLQRALARKELPSFPNLLYKNREPRRIK